MSIINQIQAPIAEEMKKFETYFRAAQTGKVPLLDTITNYILRRKGKQMRPMFVFLAAKLCGQISQSTYNAASLIELLHTATLIHDDVVDDSYKRRGFFSIKALWRSKIAVLVGDYFLSQGLLLAVRHKELQLLEIVSEAVQEMSEGELLQIEKARGLNTSEELYFEIIRKKTATLIAACTAAGAKSVLANDSIVEKMKKFGEYTGIAFQIKDDLFDYQRNSITGKPSGNDIQEKKLTLPLLHVLNKVDRTEKHKMLKIVSKHSGNSNKVSELIGLVEKNGGIEYAFNKMVEFKEKAIEILTEFEPSPARTSLQALVEYAVSRKK